MIWEIPHPSASRDVIPADVSVRWLKLVDDRFLNQLYGEEVSLSTKLVSFSAATVHEPWCCVAGVTFADGSQMCPRGNFSPGALLCSNCGASCKVVYICPLHEVRHNTIHIHHIYPASAAIFKDRSFGTQNLQFLA